MAFRKKDPKTYRKPLGYACFLHCVARRSKTILSLAKNCFPAHHRILSPNPYKPCRFLIIPGGLSQKMTQTLSKTIRLSRFPGWQPCHGQPSGQSWACPAQSSQPSNRFSLFIYFFCSNKKTVHMSSVLFLFCNMVPGCLLPHYVYIGLYVTSSKGNIGSS